MMVVPALSLPNECHVLRTLQNRRLHTAGPRTSIEVKPTLHPVSARATQPCPIATRPDAIHVLRSTSPKLSVVRVCQDTEGYNTFGF